jgi:hypothetical protein
MLTLSSVHTDDCTYHYENLIAVIGDLSADNINELSAYLAKSYQVNEMQLLELIDIENYEYDGTELLTLGGEKVHLKIGRIERIGH